MALRSCFKNGANAGRAKAHGSERTGVYQRVHERDLVEIMGWLEIA